MRKLLAVLALLFALPAVAAVETTTITGKVLIPNGSGAPYTAGSITATLSSPGTAPDGASFVVVSGRATAAIASDGTVSITLVPNDVISPVGTYYVVRFSPTAPTSASWSENWTVVTTPDPIALGAVARPNTPPGLAAPVSFVMEEGVSLPRRTKLNFTGAGSTCVDNPGQSRIDCTITSGSAALADPGSNSIVKRTALNVTAPAVAGTDYVVPSGNTATSTLAATATALAADPADCTGSNWSKGINASGVAQCSQPNFTDIAGVASVAQGGAGAAPSVADQILVSLSSSTAAWKTVTNCTGATKAVTYDISTHTFGCNTITGGAGTVVGTGVPATSELAAYTDTTGLSIKPTGILRSGVDVVFPGSVSAACTPGSGNCIIVMPDNTVQPTAPASGYTNFWPLGGEWYKQDNADGVNARLFLNSGNVSGGVTCDVAGVCTLHTTNNVTFVMNAIATGDVGTVRIPVASTVTRFNCWTVGGSSSVATVTANVRASAAPATSTGANVVAATTCDTTTVAGSVSLTTTAITAGQWLYLTYGTITGAPSALVVSMDYTTP